MKQEPKTPLTSKEVIQIIAITLIALFGTIADNFF